MAACEVVGGGGPGDFALVRHVRLEGTQAEIGSGIAGLAWANHGVRPQPSADPALTRARRRWREVHWPQLVERVRGVADYWHLAYDDRTEAACLPVPPGRLLGGLVAAAADLVGATLSRAFDSHPDAERDDGRAAKR